MPTSRTSSCRGRASRPSILFDRTGHTPHALLDRQELDVEDERRVWRNGAAGAALAVAELRRNDERPLSTDLHAGDTLIPAADDRARTEAEFERLAVIPRAVELLAV